MEKGRIPNRLKKYRRLAGYSQTEVSRLLAIPDTSSISRWEKGHCMPGLVVLLQLSVLYQTFPHLLYEDIWQTVMDDIDFPGEYLSAH